MADTLIWTGIENFAEHRGYNTLWKKTLACRDTVKSLNINFGDGHKDTYFKISGNSEKEFIAHLFENKFAGNQVFKKSNARLVSGDESF